MTTTAATPESRHGSSIDVRNPATGESIATVAVTDPDEVRSVVARARAAQPAWQALGFDGRARLFKRCQKWVLDNGERVVDTIVAETGKAWEDAFAAEVGYIAPAFGFWADHAERYLADERVRAASPLLTGRKLVVRYAPVGVVGVIGPWNYPLTNSFGDCIPALAAGNAVVLKPSEVTPLTALLMLEMMRDCGVPEDVYQVVQGYGETGGALIDAVDAVMFTGSTATGKRVMARAAETLTPVTLELGGKDPMIVCADADLERAANAAVHYSMQNAGQTCISVERVYVEAPIYREFVDRVAAKVRELRQNVPAGPGTTDVGAVINPPQADIVQRHVDDAVARGAKVLVGGHHRDEGGGRWFEPTVLVDVDHTMDCMREETFGPTLPIMEVGDVDAAVRLANDTPFGLQASVWTKDARKGERLARRLEAGGVCVNDAQVSYLALELPMGGWKQSGLGSRHGADGIRKYAKRQTILVTRFAPTKKDVHMLPYSARRSRMIQRLVGFLYGRGKRR